LKITHEGQIMDIYEKFYIYKYEKIGSVINEQNKILVRTLLTY
jgi:hypothetical protein